LSANRRAIITPGHISPYDRRQIVAIAVAATRRERKANAGQSSATPTTVGLDDYDWITQRTKHTRWRHAHTASAAAIVYSSRSQPIKAAVDRLMTGLATLQQIATPRFSASVHTFASE